jgi:hypothetical protein
VGHFLQNYSSFLSLSRSNNNERYAAGVGGGVPEDHLADLHCASDPQQPGLCQLEGPQAAGGALRPIYAAASAEAAALGAFEESE